LLKALPYKNEIAKNQIYIYWNIYEWVDMIPEIHFK
jgi:hypothetical protein